MAQTRIDEIFQGVTPSAFREYLGDQLPRLHKKYKRLVIPCAGRFSLAEVARSSLWKPKQMETSDISLFSSLIGYAFSGRDFDGLGVRIVAKQLEFLREYVGTKHESGAYLYAMKWAQLALGNAYDNMFLEEMARDPDLYVKRLSEEFDELVSGLRGASYAIADMWEVIASEKDDSKAILLVNPPGYAHGYAKMFNFEDVLEWGEPEIEEFDPASGHRRMYEELMDAPALAIMYRYKEVEDEFSSHAVFASEYSMDRVDRWLCNRPGELEKKIKLRPRVDLQRVKRSLLPLDYEITPDCKVTVASVDKGVAAYYRDLFAHKLGSARSEQYYLVLVDDYVFSVFGLHYGNLMKGQGDRREIHETFGFTVSSNRYARLNKLFMMFLVSGEMLSTLKSVFNMTMIDVDGLQTTCLTPYPELKTNRGILKVRNRELMSGGLYKLDYAAPFNEMSFADCIEKWIAKGWANA